ncbi:hypothetical protein J2S00_001808 [Caldalkalibacillus uzonensis]|uniref:YheC/YheD family protein n=1 Tax=Caldalkalibacillus uzonensis TaxID=353224 RepID=A0ABU0CRH3_9BACI|nr:YheC/YheD family protein [Caldalkalibacillus uzonensis]MDQ0339022.1 hypothetical protein [Caldalkalibacillus uzonensis]
MSKRSVEVQLKEHAAKDPHLITIPKVLVDLIEGQRDEQMHVYKIQEIIVQQNHELKKGNNDFQEKKGLHDRNHSLDGKQSPEKNDSSQKDKTIHLKVGLFDEEVNYAINETDHVMELSPALMKKLCLMNGTICHAKYEDKSIRLGPVTGIFVSQSYTDKLFYKQKAKRRTMELMGANRDAHNILYFFSMSDVDFSNKKVIGTYYDDHEKRWKRREFPFPDVLYDRGSGRPNSRLPKQAFRMKLETETPIKKINAQHYFDKWDLYYKLSQYPEMRPYLPFTILYQNPQDLQAFRGTNKVYVKKCVSSNGRRIMRVERKSPSRFDYSYYTTKLVVGTKRNIRDVAHLIEHKFGREQVIVQRAIDLPTIDGSNIDMRATVQRDGEGKLDVTAVAVRVGGKGCPVTSTRTGAKCYRFEDFYKTYYGYSNRQVKKLRKRVDDFLKKVYHYTEKAYGAFGEIGIDFAFDKQGNIWFIECNAKPAKSALHRSYDRETIRKAFVYPLEYAKYITGF